MNIYEQFGRQAEQLQQTTEAFLRTLEALRMIRDGKVLPSQLVVEDNSWHVKEPDEDGDDEQQG